MIRIRALAGIAAAAVVTAGSAMAQPVQDEFDAVFQKILARPADAELNRRFIELAIERKDYEAALGSVERLLFEDPDNAELQFLAGDLYFKLESYVVAKSYFEVVQQLDTASPELKAEAERMLAEIEDALTPSPWRFYAQAGTRFQTNANAGPPGLNLDPEGQPIEDWNSFALFSLGHTLPIGEIGAWESQLRGYGADQATVDRLDLLLLDVSSGPRFFLSEDKRVSVRPYALASHVWLGGDDYQTVAAGGLSARFGIANTWIEPYAEYRDREYYNSDDYPTATERAGDFVTAAVRAWGEFDQNWRWNTRFGYNMANAVADFESFDQAFLDISLPISIATKFGPTASIVVTPFAAFEWTEYWDSEDPLDPDRSDFEYRVGTRVEIPMNKTAGISIQVQYQENKSNLEIYSFENLSVTFGPTVRF